MKVKEQKIKIVYEEIEVMEYVVELPVNDDFNLRAGFIKKQYENIN